ncbi:hypothetical protein Tsubulata_044659, partial [Turnera subulata]
MEDVSRASSKRRRSNTLHEKPLLGRFAFIMENAPGSESVAESSAASPATNVRDAVGMDVDLPTLPMLLPASGTREETATGIGHNDNTPIQQSGIVKLRDECIVEHGEAACAKWIDAHLRCLWAEGFNL